MKIWIMTICRNEERMLPHYLAHYSTFADRILVWDDKSTDNTRSILSASPLVELRDWPFDTGIDDETFLNFSYAAYRTARGRADWIMWVDVDELIYHPNMRHMLERADGLEVIRTCGFNMIGDGTGIPQFDGRQIYDRFPLGVRAPVYSKPVVFRPHIDIKWNRGKHALEHFKPRVSSNCLLKLLHFRYLGYDYAKARNANNYSRVGIHDGDKGCAWTCAPDYNGEHSAEWTKTLPQHSFNVLEASLYD